VTPTPNRPRKQVVDLERQLAAQQQHNREREAEMARLPAVPAGATPAAEKRYVGLKTLIAGTDAKSGPP
jgi:hypothetical protein